MAFIFCEKSCSLNFPYIYIFIPTLLAQLLLLDYMILLNAIWLAASYFCSHYKVLRPYFLVIYISLSTITLPIDFYIFRLHSRLSKNRLRCSVVSIRVSGNSFSFYFKTFILWNWFYCHYNNLSPIVDRINLGLLYPLTD